ncbi:MAG: type 2 isopentenyl-diphosphate Delta-isomerase [archaeon]|nr:type 2 isopentenyl-diphosphate Delta-isomerase [Candidatus Micrarchaeota archaeon]
MGLTEERKNEHIEISLKENVQFKEKTNGFEDVELCYETLPEINKKEIELEKRFLGKKFNAPVMVTAITGGTKKAREINKDIALACEKTGIGMGLGSMRAMIEKKELSETYFVRDVAPEIFLAGNIGVMQLNEFSVKEIENALKEVKADAIAVHVNAAQEAFQEEGDTNFRGALEAINKFAGESNYPVIVKEVGHGINAKTARELEKTKVKAIDVEGSGGTSWIGIDSLRGNKEIGETYWDFGIPTAASLIEVRKNFKREVIASGGIRNGMEIVKALVMGAELGGIALPVLEAQEKGGTEGVENYLNRIIEEIRTGMFLVGAKNLKELKGKKYIVKGNLRNWVENKG